MPILSSNLDHHTLHAFDVELDKLEGMLSNLADLLLIQLELSLQALEKADSQYATDAIGLASEIAQIKAGADARVLAVIARFSPVANDLHAMVLFSKVADRLDQVGRGISDFGLFVKTVLDSADAAFPAAMLADAIETGRYVLNFLHSLKIAMDVPETDTLFGLLEADRDYETALYNKLQDELIRALRNKSAADAESLMKIIKLLEFCPGELRRIFALVILHRLSDVAFRHQWISEAAYFIAERRNFRPGFEDDDWFSAEQQFQTRMLMRYDALAGEYGGLSAAEIDAFHQKQTASKI